MNEGILRHFSNFLFSSDFFHFPVDSDLSNRFWDFGGSTVVSTNQYVRLTPDRQSKKGWLWSKMVREPSPFAFLESFLAVEEIPGGPVELTGTGASPCIVASQLSQLDCGV